MLITHEFSVRTPQGTKFSSARTTTDLLAPRRVMIVSDFENHNANVAAVGTYLLSTIETGFMFYCSSGDL